MYLYLCIPMHTGMRIFTSMYKHICTSYVCIDMLNHVSLYAYIQ